MCLRSEYKFSSLTKIPSVDYPSGTVLECDKCRMMIKLGAGGSYNLQQHVDSAACRAAANKVTRKPPKKDGTLLGFLQKKVPLVPSKAPTLSNIHAPKILNSPNPPKLAPSSPSSTRASSIPSSSLPTQTREPCTTAICLLDHLREKLNQIPTTEPEATETHRLASFAADAESYVLGDPQDDWENVLNPMFHQAFGLNVLVWTSIDPEIGSAMTVRRISAKN